MDKNMNQLVFWHSNSSSLGRLCTICCVDISVRSRQDGRVAGLKLTSSYKNTKITTNCSTIINKKDWNLHKNIFYIQGQKRSHNKTVGRALS